MVSKKHTFSKAAVLFCVIKETSIHSWTLTNYVIISQMSVYLSFLKYWLSLLLFQFYIVTSKLLNRQQMCCLVWQFPVLRQAHCVAIAFPSSYLFLYQKFRNMEMCKTRASVSLILWNLLLCLCSSLLHSHPDLPSFAYLYRKSNFPQKA